MNNPETVQLYIPTLEELDFYQSRLLDPDTMSYNAPWFPPNGCIPFPKEKWEPWYERWVNQEPERFYAYLQRTDDKAFVGDVNFHYNQEDDWWDMGIVILAEERGKGYAKQGLKLLLQRAFEVNNLPLLHNHFERGRKAAYHLHLLNGFKEGHEEEGIAHLYLTREDYFRGLSGDSIV